MTISRRQLLMGGTAFAATVAAGSAFADTPNSTKIEGFYVAVSKAAFETTYGDKLSPANISNFDDVKTALSGTADTYRENLLKASEAYFSELSADDANTLMGKLTKQPFRKGNSERNFMSAVANDAKDYTHKRIRAKEGRTNPFFWAMHTLATEDKISKEEAVSVIGFIEGITNSNEIPEGQDVSPLQAFHSDMMQRVKPVVEKLTANPVVGPAAPKLDNPFN